MANTLMLALNPTTLGHNRKQQITPRALPQIIRPLHSMPPAGAVALA